MSNFGYIDVVVVGGGGGVVRLADAEDVSIDGTQTTDDVLAWDGIHWVATPQPVPSYYVGDLNDVSSNSPNSNDVLQWSGSEWYPTSISVPYNVGDLGDVNSNWPNTDDVLQWNGSEWYPTSQSNYIGDLNDVNSNGPSSDDVLRWNGSEWYPTSISTPYYVGDLNDVSSYSPKSNDVLQWNGSEWYPTSISTPYYAGDLYDVSSNGPSQDDVLKWNGSEWYPTSISTPSNVGDLGDVNSNWPNTDDVLQWNGSEWYPTSQSNYLGDLNDVNSVSPSNDDVLRWNGSEWYPSPISTPSYVADLYDVSSNGPNFDDVLRWNGSEWYPTSISTPYYVGDLNDVNSVSPSNDDVLRWNGSEWYPSAPAASSSPVFKSYSFTSRDSVAGTNYLAGFYAAAADAVTLTNATATSVLGYSYHPYAANAFIVAGGSGVTDGSNLVLSVTGTSISDDGVRTTADSETIIANCTAAGTNAYFETTKRWLGQVTFTLTSTGGTAFSFQFNHGFVKCEDYGNRDFTLSDFECVGFTNDADSGFDVELIHHRSTGWTFAATGFTPGPTPLYSMNDAHGSEQDLGASRHFAFKKAGLSEWITGSGNEGLLVRITTTTVRSVAYMDTHIGITL